MEADSFIEGFGAVFCFHVKERNLPLLNDSVCQKPNERQAVATTPKPGIRAYGADLRELVEFQTLASHCNEPTVVRPYPEVPTHLDRFRQKWSWLCGGGQDQHFCRLF